MSVEVLALVLHHSKAKGTEKLVLLGIANHAGDGGAWPTVSTLARYANVEERSVQRALERLVASGELTVSVQAGGNAAIPAWQRPNRYDVQVSCPATCDRTHNHRHTRLPAAPADLWTNRVTPTSPGDAHVTPPVTPTSPPGVTPTSPKPSLEPDTPTGCRSVTVPRANCSVCCLPAEDCERRSRISGHDYQPRVG